MSTVQLFPPSVRGREQPITESSLDALYPDELALVADAVESRRLEFATGRRLARELLRELGYEDAPLLPDRRRAPQWPRGAVGSITHTGGSSAVAVALETDVAALGIDIEATLELDEKLWGQILTPIERHSLAPLPADEARSSAMQIFCAKEALFKAQYTLTRSWLGFEGAAVAVATDGSLEIDVREPAVRRALEPFAVSGVVRVGNRITAAVTCIRR